jgi:hypothetical protein
VFEARVINLCDRDIATALEQVVCMKVVGNCLIFPPTKFFVILPSRTPDMGKMLSSVWAGLQERF